MDHMIGTWVEQLARPGSADKHRCSPLLLLPFFWSGPPMPDSCMGDGHSALRGRVAVLVSQAKPQKMGPTCPPT